MLFSSPLFAKASGSLAGTTFSHNRGGMYTRARVVPTDPGSTKQGIVRAAMGTLAPYWGNTLTAGERDAWDSYAAAVAMTNKIGEQVYLTGQNHFIRANVPRIQAGLTLLKDAPTNYDLGTFTAPTLDAATDTPDVDVGFTNTDDWAIASGGYLLVWVGRPQGAGINFFKGPWQYAGKVTGAATPPTSPETITSPFTLTIGQKVWVQCRFIQTDGRLSLPIRLGPETVVAGA